MKISFYSLIALTSVLFNASLAISSNTLLDEKDPSFIRKQVESLHYSPFLVEQYDPEQLIQNWTTLNAFYKNANERGHKEFGEELIFKQEQLKRLLDNLGTHIRSRNMSETAAFNFQYVTFSEVCLTDNEKPDNIAQHFNITGKVLEAYLNHNQ